MMLSIIICTSQTHHYNNALHDWNKSPLTEEILISSTIPLEIQNI